MIQVDDIIAVEIKNIQVYGLFCTYQSLDILVLIPELSWVASFNSSDQFASVGDNITIIVTGVDLQNNRNSGSIKACHPNPWSTKQILLGASYSARVVRFVKNSDRCNNNSAYLIELLPGSFVMLSAQENSLKHLSLWQV